ncbi:MAG TPA: hypothetical protein ENN77_01270, partial [Candidatus Wirthbacteria bacterium]|nr:hypothetical protein [Candidatus Wirthbacteria bacterium]
MCGIAAAYQLNSKQVSTKQAMLVNRLLLRLQNRGDLSTGIANYNPEGFNILNVKKGRGTAKDFYGEPGSYKNDKMLESLKGLVAIGHNRYATSGDPRNEDEVYALSHPY